MTKEIVSSTNVGFLVIAGCGVPMLTIIVCWLIALSLGHVPLLPWPMISDCGWEAPEKYIFRLGLVFSATLLARLAVVVRDYIKYESSRVERTHIFSHNHNNNINNITSECWSIEDISVPIAQVASVCLAMLSAISEKENVHVHSISAVIFFILYILYECLISWKISSVMEKGGRFSAGGFTFKKLLSILCVIDFILYTIVASVKGFPFWYQAVCEWSGVFMILLYNGSFIVDLNHKMFLAAAYETNTHQVYPPMVYAVPLEHIQRAPLVINAA